MELMNQTILGNNLLQWLTAATVFVFCVFLLRFIQYLARRRLTASDSQSKIRWHQVIAKLLVQTRLLLLFIIGVFVGALFLELPSQAQTVLSSLLVVALLMQAGLWGNSFIVIMLESYRQHAKEQNPAAITTINVLGLIGKIALWSTVTLLALDNLGVNITALVAGLGIGGVAVALALQNILGDLFASLSIVLDKPFVIGDFLIIGEYMGSVEYVGLKTTRIRSLSGEQLVFSNSDLLNSRIRNYGRMFERRVVFSIGVTYDTPREKLRLIPEIIWKSVVSQKQTRFDRSHFMKYGDYALTFESVYYVLSPDYNAYMDIQQEIYFAIHERFEQENIRFAYPTQTLFVTQSE